MRIHAAGASLLLAVAIWLSSGTLSPYSATVAPIPTEPCHYLVNGDHAHHIAPFLLLAGADARYWSGSVVLRRILYPIIAYPFVRVAGMLPGGLICNIIITIAAMLAFGRFVRARFGERAAVAVMWLLATYPGITYWAGLPYSYAAIVPASLLCAMLLYRIDAAADLHEICAAALMLGIVLLAYDLFPFFVPAAVLILLFRRMPLAACAAGAIAMIPTLAVNALMTRIGASPSNSNIYGNLIGAYLHPHALDQWRQYLFALPFVAIANYFDSNFFFLPLLAILVIVVYRRRAFGRIEWAILASAVAVFLFNNAAPPYYGWQMRGFWIARLYQPLFVVLLICVARALTFAPKRLVTVAVVVTIVANAAIALGPVMMNPMAFYFDERFYQHSPPGTFAAVLNLYGRRPLGFCRTSHEGDNLPPPPLSLARPPFAYRTPPRNGQ